MFKADQRRPRRSFRTSNRHRSSTRSKVELRPFLRPGIDGYAIAFCGLAREHESVCPPNVRLGAFACRQDARDGSGDTDRLPPVAVLLETGHALLLEEARVPDLRERVEKGELPEFLLRSVIAANRRTGRNPGCVEDLPQFRRAHRKRRGIPGEDAPSSRTRF